jgi:lipoyl(octanoyl) transferase
MDLEPFRRINPCGYPGLRVTQLTDLGIVCDTDLVTADLLRILLNLFGYTAVQRAEGLPTIKSQETVHA